MKIKSINRKILNTEKKFYDITVDKYHNFLIGKESMLVTHNSSLSKAIINLAQSFKNNAPLLEEDGQFGSLRSPESGAPRYIGTKLSSNFRLIYKDFELLEYKKEEGEKIEPYFFLPIIPMILVNGSQGIAVGFASNILNRNIKDVIKQCKKVIEGKRIINLKPSLNQFKGDWIENKNNTLRWIIRGKFEKLNTTTILITELPPSITYEKYEKHLDKLIQDKLIEDYEDNCKDDINYKIKFKRTELNKLNESDLIKLLNLEEFQTENLSTLDENGRLKLFESVNDMIKYFVNFRLTYYEKRKDFLLRKSMKDLDVLNNKLKFIKLILEKKIEINNKTKSNIVKQIEKNKISKIDESYDYLLRLPIYSLTKEIFDKLKNDTKNKEEEIKSIKKSQPKEMYLNDLDELLKKC